MSLPPMAWWALQPDVSRYYSASGESFVAYRVDGSVAVTVGEPMGVAAEIPALMGRSTRWLAARKGPGYEREVVHRDDLVILGPARRRART